MMLSKLLAFRRWLYDFCFPRPHARRKAEPRRRVEPVRLAVLDLETRESFGNIGSALLISAGAMLLQSALTSTERAGSSSPSDISLLDSGLYRNQADFAPAPSAAETGASLDFVTAAWSLPKDAANSRSPDLQPVDSYFASPAARLDGDDFGQDLDSLSSTDGQGNLDTNGAAAPLPNAQNAGQGGGAAGLDNAGTQAENPGQLSAFPDDARQLDPEQNALNQLRSMEQGGAAGSAQPANPSAASPSAPVAAAPTNSTTAPSTPATTPVTPPSFTGNAPVSSAPIVNSTVTFQQNVGQVADGQTQFVSQAAGYTALLAPTEATIVLQPNGQTTGGTVTAAQEAAGLQMTFVGANPTPQVVTLLPASTAGQGQTPATFGQLTYENVYSGINLSYQGNSQGQVEYSFTVAPNANPGTIQLQFSGATGLSLDSQGNLVVQNASGELVQQAPQLSQLINGQQQAVAGSFVLLGNNLVGFQVAQYDHTQALTIDPTIARGTTLNYDFSNPSGVLGTSQTYTPTSSPSSNTNNPLITAYGFSTSGTPEALFGKTEGGDESGLGISRPGTDNEIQSNDFVQLDLTNLLSQVPPGTTLQLAIGSVQSGEGYDIYGSNSLLTSGGSLGTLLVSGGTLDDTYFTVPGNYSYLGISAHQFAGGPNSDVLVVGLQVNVPKSPPNIPMIPYCPTCACSTCTDPAQTILAGIASIVNTITGLFNVGNMFSSSQPVNYATGTVQLS
ncbi:MAG TPA: hypothetical protein VJY33_14870, partial [Isosphaeraceae bacterium]|nr:hypothetical protein [Isosphaeraceae bacterium]